MPGGVVSAARKERLHLLFCMVEAVGVSRVNLV